MARQYLNLADIYGRVDASRANQAQLENNQLLQERQRRQFALEDEQLGEQRALKDVYRGAVVEKDGMPSLDEKRLLSDLYRVAPEKALAQQEAFSKREADAVKLKGETSKQALENKKATVAYVRDRLATVQDQASYDALLQEANDLGATALIQSAPPEFNPEWTRQQLFTADKFLEQSTPKYEKVDLGGKIQVIDVNPMTNPSIKGSQFDKTATIGERESMRHNRATEYQSAATLAETKRKNSQDGGAGKAPAGYRFLPDGSLEAIKGGPAAKGNVKLQEGERKAATLLSRLKNSKAQLDAAIKTNPDAAKPELLASGIRAFTLGQAEALANTSTSDSRQQVESAQLDMLDAALTLGTGAAYTKEQLEGYRKSYFPQLGDSDKAVKDKQDRLNNIIKAAEIAAGGAANLVKTPKQPNDVRSEADKILGL